jgi:rRNA maturation protein Rpf1
MITILNTSILTAEGLYEMSSISLDEAKVLVADGFESAVGHQSTSEIISELLGVSVPMNRVMYQQAPGDAALVFKLAGRPPEGTILSREEIEATGYSFYLLVRKA